MRHARSNGPFRLGKRCVVAILALIALARIEGPAASQGVSLQDLVSGVVRIKTFINPDGRTLQNLGRDREGTGIVIDDSGLILTIGYLMVEAHTAEVTTSEGRTAPADIVGYDHDTGFGLLKAVVPLKARPLPLGTSAAVKTDDPLVVVGFGGAARAAPVRVVAKREFAGYWEYLLDDAIFTTPPYSYCITNISAAPVLRLGRRSMGIVAGT